MLEPINGGVRRHGTFREPATQGLSRIPRGQGPMERDHSPWPWTWAARDVRANRWEMNRLCDPSDRHSKQALSPSPHFFLFWDHWSISPAHPTLPQATADDTQRLCELMVGTGSLRACRPWDQDCHLGKRWSRYEERRQYTKQGGREGAREGDREVGERMREDCRS